jgi:LPS-assembly protein
MIRAASGLLMALLLWSAQIGLAQTQPRKGEIDVTAEQLTVEEAGNVIRARGNVEIKREDVVLKAESVRVNREKQEVEAKGQVSIVDPEWKLKAESIRMDMREEKWEIEQGEVFIEESHISLSGRSLKKFDGQAYHIDDGSFTTCLCESGTPTWQIKAREIGLTREGKGFIKGGTFHLLDVPVLYLPYAFFPMRTERQSGFLFPKMGYSSRGGFRYQQPYFWAINKSTDLTLQGNVETRTRLGAIGEFRKVFNRDSNLYVNGSYFNETWRNDAEDDIEDTTIDDPNIPQDRWSAVDRHRYQHRLGWITYSDIFVLSDDLFTRELVYQFDVDNVRVRDIQTSRYARSRVGFFNHESDMFLRGEWDAFQDFIQDDDDTFFRLPNLSFWGEKNFGLPVEFSWRAESVNYMREKGADGFRLDLRPEVSLPFRLFPYLDGSLDAAPRGTVYYLHRTEGIYDKNKIRSLVELKGNVGTSVSNHFAWNGSELKKIKHMVEPRVNYLFIPGTNQSDIPIMDGVDRVNRRNILNFSLVNRFLGKFVPPPSEGGSDRGVELLTPSDKSDVREMGHLGLALNYDIDKERNGGDTLSDLEIDFKWTPADFVSLEAFTGLNPGPWQFSQAWTQVSWTDPRPILHRVLDKDFMKSNSLSLSYRFIRRNQLAPLAENANLTVLPLEDTITRNVLEEVGLHSILHVTDNILILYDGSYDARDSRFTGNRGGIKLLSPCECWTVGISVNHTTNPDKTSFNFDIGLLGLGSTK